MNQLSKLSYVNAADWEDAYRQGTPPWDINKPHAELLQVLDEGHFRSGTVLELGCGTGADAVCLARRRFDVTAVDCSAIALERARLCRAGRRPAAFVLSDVFEFASSAGQFDVVYDAGFYHFFRLVNLHAYLDMLRARHVARLVLFLPGLRSRRHGHGRKRPSPGHQRRNPQRAEPPVRDSAICCARLESTTRP